MKTYKAKLLEKLIGHIKKSYGETDIYKNPKTLKNFPAGIRGIIDKSGNLYVMGDSYSFIHQDLVSELKNLKQVPNVDYNFIHLDLEYLNYFLEVQESERQRNNFYLGESLGLKTIKNNLPVIKKYIELANKKHPQFKFHAESIRA